MDPLFVEVHGILEQLNTLFVHLEKHIGHSDEIQIEESIKSKLDNMNPMFDRLEVYVLKEPPTRRQASRLKLNQMKYDSQHLHASLRNFQKKRYHRERENNEREELLNRRFTANSDDTSISMDHAQQQQLHHNNSLQNANRSMDDLLGQGYAMIGNLRDQRNMLKKTKTRMLSFLNTVGLSNTVMQLIERRAFQDKYILFGGMAVTVVIMFFIYLYLT